MSAGRVRQFSRDYYAALGEALYAEGLGDDEPTRVRVAVLHGTPGADVVAGLVADGWPTSSAVRAQRAADEALGPRPDDPEHSVRRALADAVYYLEHPDKVIPANRVRQLRQLAGVRLVEAGEPFARGMEGSARAAAKWTDDEVAQVDKAIATVRERCLAVQAETIERVRGQGYQLTDLAFEQTFTADDVWAELGDGFLVTKGLAGRLTAASNRGLIASTGKTVISTRDDEHGHGQRLTLWRARRPEDAF